MNAHLLALGSVLVVNMNKDCEIKKKIEVKMRKSEIKDIFGGLRVEIKNAELLRAFYL